MKQIYRKDYKDWAEYYYQYQFLLAREHYIPYLNRNNINLNRISIIDVGCGNGGFISAFPNSSSKTGLEVKEFSWKNIDSTTFKVHNILIQDNAKFIKKYDLAILRDVIEHIDLKQKEVFINNVKSFLNEKGKLLITFPPYYSPFGLHQQALMKSFLRKIPYLSLLPFSFIRILCRLFEDSEVLKELEEIVNSRMTISNFKSIIIRSGMKICNEEYFFVRPSHQIRYGFKVKKACLSKVPILNELFVLGASYIIEKK